MSGLAGFYLLRDTADTVGPLLPSGEFEVPLAIQDRTFKLNGDFWFPEVGLNPTIHPYWMPEFFGDTIMVNGLVWPNMNVKQGLPVPPPGRFERTILHPWFFKQDALYPDWN